MCVWVGAGGEGPKGGRLVYSLSREREQNVTFNGAELKDSD